MREEYVPNEKYRNMFGIERNGYGMERVDLYLAQLEVAFKKIREDNRNLKQEVLARESTGSFSERMAAPQMGYAPAPDGVIQQLAAQEQYINQLQAQIAEQQRRQAELMEQNQRLAAQLHEADAIRPDEQLLQQMAALRAEADELRRQLRRQVAPAQQMPQYPDAPRMDAPGMPGQPMDMPADPRAPDTRQDMIGKVLVGAQAQAEEIRRAAQMEADQAVLLAKQNAEQTLQAAKQTASQTMQAAKQTADQTLHAAKQTADQTLQAAKRTADQTLQAANRHAEETIEAADRQVNLLRTEKERVRAQLEELSYALRGVLRLSEKDNTQRGEEFGEK